MPNSKSRRPRNNPRRRRPPVNAQTPTVVWTRAEKRLIAALTTPFADEARGAKILDSASGDTAAFTLSTEIVVTAPADGCINAALNPHFTHNYLCFTHSEGATPTGVNQNTWYQSTALNALEGNIRYVGGSIECHSTVGDDDKIGRIQAGRCTKVLRTSSAPTYSTAAELSLAMVDRDGRYSASLPDDGGKVRIQPFGPEDRTFAPIGSSPPALVDGKVPNVSTYPTMLITGAVSGETFSFKCVLHCEYFSNAPDLLTEDMSPYSPRYELIVANAATNPVTASGHSFMSFVKSIQKATKYAAEVTQTALPYISTGASLASAIAGLAIV